MSFDSDRYWIVFNGEIYNYLELREELEKEGARFRSRSDTEVLLEALVRWGTEALPRLVGMFAFAWLDTRADRLVLARDAFGIKPLFWTESRAPSPSPPRSRRCSSSHPSCRERIPSASTTTCASA